MRESENNEKDDIGIVVLSQTLALWVTLGPFLAASSEQDTATTRHNIRARLFIATEVERLYLLTLQKKRELPQGVTQTAATCSSRLCWLRRTATTGPRHMRICMRDLRSAAGTLESPDWSAIRGFFVHKLLVIVTPKHFFFARFSHSGALFLPELISCFTLLRRQTINARPHLMAEYFCIHARTLFSS